MFLTKASPTTFKHNCPGKSIKNAKRGNFLTFISAWAFLIVGFTREDGKPKVFFHYRPFNRKVKQNWLPLPSINDILEERDGCSYFKTSKLF